MNQRQLLTIVKEFHENKHHDVYRLAARIAEEQKELDAELAEKVGHLDLAATIRSS